MDRVKGRIAIVTGGAQGLGKAISMRLAEEGAYVNIFDIGDAEPAVKEIRDAGFGAKSYTVNVAKHEEVESAVQAAIKKFGKVDILVNNAGVVSAHENLLTVTNEIWDREIAIDLTGTFYCCRYGKTSDQPGLFRRQSRSLWVDNVNGEVCSEARNQCKCRLPRSYFNWNS